MFVSWPAHDTARLTEAFRRAVLRLSVRLDLFDADQAVALERLTYDRAATAVTYRSDKSNHPTRDRDGAPAGVPGAGAGPHPRQGPGHHPMRIVAFVSSAPIRLIRFNALGLFLVLRQNGNRAVITSVPTIALFPEIP
ncbi:MAG: hypothetical protein ABI661_12580 [Gammaproteobacteria bacterium]